MSWVQDLVDGGVRDSCMMWTTCAQAVIVSPLMRALETAAGVFGGGPFDGRGRPLMVAQTEAEDERAAHGAVACADGLPFIAFEGCRERLGARPGPAPPPAGCPVLARCQRVPLRVPGACRCGAAHSAGCRRQLPVRAAGTRAPCRDEGEKRLGWLRTAV